MTAVYRGEGVLGGSSSAAHEWYADEAHSFRYHSYPANQVFGIQSNFQSFMQSVHRVARREAGRG